MDHSTLAVIFAGAALALNLGQRLFGGGWNLKGNMASLELSMKSAVADAVSELEAKHREASHDFGETVSALKEHVRQVEFHIRDNYIRKDDLIVYMKSHDELLSLNFENIKSRLDRIEKRLDGASA